MARTALITIAAALAAVAIAPATIAAADEPSNCQARVAVNGSAHKIKSVAELNALRAWLQSSQKFGDAYAMWHNASGASIACESLGQGYFRCAAAGKPCMPRSADKPQD